VSIEHRPVAEELGPGRGVAYFCAKDGQEWPCDHEQGLALEEPPDWADRHEPKETA
jgi:hypothetical protein